MKVPTKIINPHTKFRKKINAFDLCGDFLVGKKRLYSLIDAFHEEYILNQQFIPKLQWEYYPWDVKYIDTKLQSLQVLMRNKDADQRDIDRLVYYWEETKNIIQNKTP